MAEDNISKIRERLKRTQEMAAQHKTKKKQPAKDAVDEVKEGKQELVSENMETQDISKEERERIEGSMR